MALVRDLHIASRSWTSICCSVLSSCLHQVFAFHRESLLFFRDRHLCQESCHSLSSSLRPRETVLGNPLCGSQTSCNPRRRKLVTGCPRVAGPAEWLGCVRLAARLKKPTVSQRDSCNNVRLHQKMSPSHHWNGRRSLALLTTIFVCFLPPHANESVVLIRAWELC